MDRAICCVLRSGGDFKPAHVEWLRDQCAEHMPDWQFFCWSDMNVPGAIPLKTDWPKWWAKFEIYDPDSPVRHLPTLIVDLDTVFRGPIEILPQHEAGAIFIRDPYRDWRPGRERFGNGFTYMSAVLRQDIWDLWQEMGPRKVIEYSQGDDQWFLTHFLGTDPRVFRWSDHYVDQVVSYKAHVRPLGLRAENRVVYFHGQPRPWDAAESWIPSLPEP